MLPTLQRFMLIGVIAGMSFFSAAGQSPVSDFLSVPGPVQFNNNSYSLSWSAHPAADFFKQEYIPRGENPDSYKTMLLLDAVTGKKDIKTVLAAKVAELRKMKATNPIVQYEVISNAATGEYMLDFILSANAPDGSIAVIERNVYRYSNSTAKNGLKIVLLFGVSSRAYGKDATPFLTALKTNRKDLVNKVALFKLPLVQIK
jgi:hypothetical protein